MYLDHLVPPLMAVFSAPGCFLRRMLHRDLVSFGLLANLDTLEHRGLFQGIDGIIDVGANIGQFAYMAHTIWPRLPIYSFEPDQDCFAQLECTFNRFRIPGRCFPFAVSDEAGQRRFYIYENRADNSFLLRNDTEMAAARDITVTCVTLDGLADELDAVKCPMLKVDVQGFELSVLRGATSLLRRCKYVQIEVSFYHSYKGNAHAADVLNTMRDYGFICFDILDILRMPKVNGHGIREVDLLFVNELLHG